MCQRVVRHKRSDVPQFGRFRFQEFASRRHAVKNICHADRSPARHARRLHAQQLAPREFDASSFSIFARARLEKQPRNRGNRWQRFAAKAKRCNRKQIVSRPQFRSRVPLERQQRIVMIHPAAIIDHANHALPAGFHFDSDRLRPGIQRILQQFLHHRGGPLDNLPSSNFIRHIFSKDADAAHRGLPLRAGGFKSEYPPSNKLLFDSRRTRSSSSLSSCIRLRRKIRVPNKLAINTTVTSEIPSHIGNTGICTIIRKIKPIVTPSPKRTPN